MKQHIALITLGIADLARSRRFYGEGFGWTPVFDNDEVAFYQMNGFIIATWLKAKLDDDMRRANANGSGAVALA